MSSNWMKLAYPVEAHLHYMCQLDDKNLVSHPHGSVVHFYNLQRTRIDGWHHLKEKLKFKDGELNSIT